MCNCSQRLIEKGKLREFNEYYDEKVYVLKDDLKISAQEMMKKGTLVRIYIESTPSLLKLKVYPASESRESSSGKLASYIINDDVKKKNYTLEDIEVWVATKLQVSEQKNKKTKK